MKVLMTRRRLFIGMATLALVFAAKLCGDRTGDRNKWLERTGGDELEPDNGKGWDDEK